MQYIMEHQKPDEKLIIQQHITQRNGQTTTRLYQRGRFLRQTQNTRHYQVRQLTSNHPKTLKILSKSQLLKSKNRQKLLSQIKNHRKFSHRNILKFHHVFEDSSNIYIIVESCPNGTLEELLNRRQRITEGEMQYYFNQLVEILLELRRQNIVHRDIKLESLYLDGDMGLKLGDFGESAECLMDRRRSIIKLSHFSCPEIINQSGHAFQADLWSVGVVLYTMLCGVEPFKAGESFSLSKIRNANFMFPQNLIVCDHWKQLLKRIFMVQPCQRLSLDTLKDWKFPQAPHYLPASLLNSRPHFTVWPPVSTPTPYQNLFNCNFPALTPCTCIQNWQLSEEVGLVYTVENFLCINFPDKSVLIGGPGNYFQYKEPETRVRVLTEEELRRGKGVAKKVMIFRHFKDEMGQQEEEPKGDIEGKRCPLYVEAYNKVDSYVVLRLSNKTTQILSELQPKQSLIIEQNGRQSFYQCGVKSDNNIKINQYLKAVGKLRKRGTSPK